jgi:hypothetical protein
MRLHELGRDSLFISCPKCQKGRQVTGDQLLEEFPPEMLVLLIVAKHYCRRCSRPGRKVRPEARIHPYPRSGAEGGDGPSKA